jgi:tRNA (cmo5U34)-methyltransferase
MKNSDTNFSKSHWANEEFAAGYLDESDLFIPQRKQVLELIKFIFSYYIPRELKNPYIIDLGCGNGVITKALMEVNNNLQSTLVDGSEHMLESAKKNIPGSNIRNTINISFQNLYKSSLIEDNADFIASSLAIHHLDDKEKDLLFKYIYSKLKPGCLFVNFDPVLSPSQELEKLNLAMWKEWILNIESKINPKRDKSVDYMPAQYKSNKDNIPGTLDSQLEMLTNAGFLDVTLYYKYGLFCLFGGRK